MISSLSKKVLAQAMLLLTLAIASTKAVSPFPSSSNPVTRQALELRGGGGGGTTTAKALTTLGLVVGTTTSLSAKTVLDKSGFNKIDPVSILTTRRIGGAILSFSLVAYLLLFQQTSASTAVGISVLPTIIDLSMTLFDGTHKELDFQQPVRYLFSLCLRHSVSYFSMTTRLFCRRRRIHSS
mmetsp:Transcript_11419/g.12943  ORF Transcript_11419/g.12943 Transcript_11419/m.12943 type:complete len:182 (-) Transcript_11419:411-956(-)